MDPLSVGQTVDHDHVTVVQKAVDNGHGPEVVVKIFAPVLPGDVAGDDARDRFIGWKDAQRRAA